MLAFLSLATGTLRVFQRAKILHLPQGKTFRCVMTTHKSFQHQNSNAIMDGLPVRADQSKKLFLF